jgi:formamidopyrimidine-DNA glycosylase
MPELPEVETTRRGIEPHINGRTVKEVIIRQPQLRWLIPTELVQLLTSKVLKKVTRRAKYLLLEFENGSLIIHLGMSGSLRVLLAEQEVKKHDHFELVFNDNVILRLTDPRRFGAVLWQQRDTTHKLLAHLGPEPLTDDFTITTFEQAAKNRSVPIKTFIMDNKVVVGVGNIYACEALYAAKIHPLTPVNQLSKVKFKTLVAAIKYILGAAIERGGTTLKDFVGGDGKPGYFAQELQVYARKGQSCNACQKPLQELKIAQRSTVFCPNCQRLPRKK